MNTGTLIAIGLIGFSAISANVCCFLLSRRIADLTEYIFTQHR